MPKRSPKDFDAGTYCTAARWKARGYHVPSYEKPRKHTRVGNQPLYGRSQVEIKDTPREQESTCSCGGYGGSCAGNEGPRGY